MAKGELGAAAFVAEVAHCAGVAAEQSGSQRRKINRTAPAAVSVRFELAIPPRNREPDRHPDI
jgi:hypothetical protein